MKTIKIILSITLVVLATTALAQRTFNMERLSPKHYHEVAYLASDNQMEKNRIEIWMHNLNGRASKKVSWDVYESPVVSRTIFVEQADILYEDELGLESWMTAPFESLIAEDELGLESWMVTPFKGDIAEQDLNVESWMTTPFKTTQPIIVEEWML